MRLVISRTDHKANSLAPLHSHHLIRTTDLLGDVMAPRHSLRSALSCSTAAWLSSGPVLVIGLLLVAVLGGCGAPAAENEPSRGSGASAFASPPSTPDPRPTPASSAGPARNAPKPVLPDVAKQNTEAGFEAFTQYWFDTATYGLENNDAEAIKSVSRPACKVCDAYVSDVLETVSKSGWAQGPRWRVVGFISDMSRDPLKQALGQFLLEESPSSRFDSAGNAIKSRTGGSDNRLKEMYAIYEDGRWLASQLGQA